MPPIATPTLDGYRTDFSTGGDTCQIFATGDPDGLNLWGDSNNANFLALQGLLHPASNGQLLIANGTTHRFVQAVPTVTGWNTVTAGAGTLALGMSSNGYIKSQEIDLTLGSSATYELFSPDVACTIVSCYLIFSEAAGAVASSLDIGNSGGTSTTYFTGSTDTGGAIFDKQSLAMSTPTIAANSTVYVTLDGAGDAGKITIYLKYKVS